MSLAISPAAAPPMPSATMKSEPLSPDDVRADFGLERRVVGREIGDDERVLVVLARAPDVRPSEDVDDDLAGRACRWSSLSDTRGSKCALAALAGQTGGRQRLLGELAVRGRSASVLQTLPIGASSFGCIPSGPRMRRRRRHSPAATFA